MMFKDREDAGIQLVRTLNILNPSNTVVLALPRGGVPLGVILANSIGCPFDVLLAKKIGHPSHSEYAIGALAEGGEPLFNEGEKSSLESDWLQAEVSRINQQLEQRREMYEKIVKKQPLKNKDVLLVDDGIATGLTMFAAIEAVKKEEPKRVMVAVPVIPKDTYQTLKKLTDYVFYVDIPNYFLGAVGAYYNNFPQVEDTEVEEMLKKYQNN